jgi:hypothetical protein
MIAMPDEQSLIAEVLGMRAPGVGDRSVWNALKGKYPGLTRNRVRTIWMNNSGAKLPAIIAPSAGLPALSDYDTARQVLARAKTLAEVMLIHDKAAAVQEFARRAKDKTLMLDAAQIRLRAEWEWGKRVIPIKESGGLNEGRAGRGRPRLGTSNSEEPKSDTRPTVIELGAADHKFSARAQKVAKTISERAIEARIAAWRETAEKSDGRLVVDLLKVAPINGARSVMASRVDRDDHALDFYPTPPWTTRALFERVLPHIFPRQNPPHSYLGSVWEPACGEGHMLKVIEEYTDRVDGSDIHDYGGMGPDSIIDFVNAHNIDHLKYDWIITNPPFKEGLTERFTLRALELANVGVAMFVRSQWAVEGVDRYERIFRDRPPTLHAYFVERVNLRVGRWHPDGGTATAYCWLVWVRDRAPMAPFYIPPGCRAGLTRPNDRARFAAWSLPEAAE